ncbi:hypothetical protein IWZ00DRAFT_193053 [Phyllosticta capitalensis]
MLRFALPEAVDIRWVRLMNNPMFLSDVNMAAILRLKQSTSSSRPPAQGTSIYYVRSFQMTINQLLHVIALWDRDRKYFSEAFAWKVAMEAEANVEQPVWVRYIGASQSVSAWNRHMDDLEQRTDAVYGAFLDTLTEYFPKVAVTAKVFEFSQVEAQPFKLPNGQLLRLPYTETDLRESTMIALFHKPTLLNRHAGGIFAHYSPPQKDVELCQKLGLKTFRRLDDGNLRSRSKHPDSQPPRSLREPVKSWMAKVVKFARDNSEKLGTDTVPITDEAQQTWTDQAVPATYYGQVVLIMLGEYPPLATLRKPVTLWNDSCRAIRLLKDFLSRIRATEMGSDSWHPSGLDTICRSGGLPWVNLHYWPRRNVLRNETRDLVRQYFSITRPILALTFEAVNCGFVRRNFVVFPDVTSMEFLKYIGEFTIQFHTDPGQLSGQGTKAVKGANPINPDDAFIQMPSFHPGADRFRAHGNEWRRVFNLNLLKVSLAVDCTFDLLERNYLEKREQSRILFCQELLARINSYWISTGGQNELQAAKDDLTRAVQTALDEQRKKGREWVKQTQGLEVNMTARGEMSLYWENPDGTHERVCLKGGTGVAPGKDDADKKRFIWL